MSSQLPEGPERKAAEKAKTGTARSADDSWPDVYEECFSMSRVAWPPKVSHINDFIAREAEVIYLANKLFPASEGIWTLFRCEPFDVGTAGDGNFVIFGVHVET